MKFREEVVNVLLAQVLRDYGLTADPEVISSGKKPDVRITVGGLKVILEGKSSASKSALAKQARERLEAGLADISMAVNYPKDLAQADSEKDLRGKVEGASYSGTVYYWGSGGVEEIKFESKSVQDLVEVLNHVYQLYIKNNLLERKINEIDAEIGQLASEVKQTSLFFHKRAVRERLKEALGIGDG